MITFQLLVFSVNPLFMQGPFLKYFILLIYFKWCWASDGATSDRLSKEKGCANHNQKFRLSQKVYNKTEQIKYFEENFKANCEKKTGKL